MHFSIVDFFLFFNLFSGKKKKNQSPPICQIPENSVIHRMFHLVGRSEKATRLKLDLQSVPSSFLFTLRSSVPFRLMYRGAPALRGWPNCARISSSYSKGEAKASYNVQAMDQTVQHLLYLTFQSVSCVKWALRDMAAPRTCLEGSQNSVLQFCLWLRDVKSVN